VSEQIFALGKNSWKETSIMRSVETIEPTLLQGDAGLSAMWLCFVSVFCTHI